jgi:hypothetical protein
MRKITTVYFICQVFILNAQIQINQSHMPSINDTARYSISTDFNKDYSKTGANVQWDFSDLNLASQDVYKFQALSSTPYSLLLLNGLPFGSIGYKLADSVGAGQFSIKNLYNFYEKTSTSWRAVGTGFTLSAVPIPTGGIHKDKDEIYTFPLKFNDVDSSTFEVSTPLGNQFLKLGTFKQKGKRYNYVDGWGTITTPYGSQIQCIKIRSVIIETDSVILTTPPTNIGIPANRVEYKWLSTTEKIPILEVTGILVNGNFTANQVRYRDNFRAPNNGNGGINPLKVNFSVNKTIGIAGKDTFSFSNLTTPTFGTSYTWTFSPSKGVRYVSGDSNSASPSVVIDSIGKFSVKLDTKNLNFEKDSLSVDLIEVVKDNQNSIIDIRKEFQIYPNPVNSILFIENSDYIGSDIKIFDNNGKLAAHYTLDNQLKIDVSKLPNGVYTLVLVSPNQVYQLKTQIIKY